MAVIGEAWIKITPTSTGFETQVVKDVEKAVAEANKHASVSFKTDTKGATGPLDLLKNKLTSFAGGSNPVTKVLGDITTASGGATSALSGMATGGLAIAAAATVAFAVKSVHAFADYTAQARALQRTTGATAEDASQLAGAFRALGIAPESAALQLGRFAKNIDASGAAMGKLGIQIAKNKDGTVNVKESFLNIADAVQKAEDPTKALNIAITAFGRGGQALLPILLKGKEGIDELFKSAGKHNEIFSQADLNRGKEYTIAMHEMKDALEGILVSGGRIFTPLFTDIAHAITALADLVGKLDRATKAVQDFFEKNNTAGGRNLGGFIDALKNKILGLHPPMDQSKKDVEAKSASEAAATEITNERAGAEAEAAAAITAAAKADQEHTKAIDNLSSAISSIIDSERNLKDATKSVTDAQTAAAVADKKVEVLRKAGVIDIQKLAQAHLDLATAEKAVTSAQDAVVSSADKVASATSVRLDALDRLAAAQDTVNKLISGQAAAEDMVAHRHDLEHANLTVRESTKALADAEQRRADVMARQGTAEAKLAALRNSHTATAKDIQTAQDEVTAAAAAYAKDYSDAQLGVDQATLTLKESQEKLVDTQKNLNDIQNEGATGSAKLKTAQKDLAQAQRDVDQSTKDLASATKDQTTASGDLAIAQQGVIDKQALVNAAMKPDPKLQSDIVTAADDAKRAHERLASAMDQASQKAFDLGTKQKALTAIAHDSLPDLQEVKANLDEIVKLQPGAASFLGPTIDMVNSLISSAVALVTATAGAATKINVKAGTGAGFDRGRGNQAYASGGYASGESFTAGENGVELVSLRPGGGAMVYAPGSPEAAGAGGMPPVSISITASFGAGTNADDVVRAMRSVAQNEITQALQAVLTKSSAGTRR